MERTVVLKGFPLTEPFSAARQQQKCHHVHATEHSKQLPRNTKHPISIRREDTWYSNISSRTPNKTQESWSRLGFQMCLCGVFYPNPQYSDSRNACESFPTDLGLLFLVLAFVKFARFPIDRFRKTCAYVEGLYVPPFQYEDLQIAGGGAGPVLR